MSAVTEVAGGATRMHRGEATWYAYLALGYHTYLTTTQGNIIPFLKADLGLSYGEVSLHPSAIAVGLFIAGMTGDRVFSLTGRRFALIAAIIGGATGAILLCLTSAAWASIGACLIMGTFSAFIPAMVSALLADLHGLRRNVAIAEANAICYVFATLGPLLIALATSLGLNWRVGILLGVAIGGAIIVRFYRTPMPDTVRAQEVSDARLSPAYWAYLAMLGFGVALEFAALLWAPSYLEKVVGLSPSAAAIGAGAFFAAMLVSRTAGIHLFRLLSLRNLYFVALATTLAGFAAYWANAGAAVAIAGLFVIGLGVGNLFPLIMGFAMSAAGNAVSRGSARAIAAPGIAILLSPPLLGTIADHWGLHIAQLMIPVFAALTAASFFTAQWLERARH